MRYYSYNEMGDNGENLIITVSEDEIRKTYYPWWKERMYKKFGKDAVDAKFSFDDCLYDWIVVNWAWESTND